MTCSHLTGVVLALLLSATGALAQPAPPPVLTGQGASQFLVFFRSQPIGREEVVVLRQADRWVIRGSSRLGMPIDITTRQAEVIYDLQWRPQSLTVEGVVRAQEASLKTTFDGTNASNVITIQGKPETKVDPVAADTIVLPNTFLGSYAALAKRLQGLEPDETLHGYIAPQTEVTITVASVASERIETPKGGFDVSHYSLTLSTDTPGGDLPIEVWTNANGDLVRLSIPSQALELAREDIASAASRTVSFVVPGDRSVQIPGSGFNLAATLTRPPAATGKLPVVVLVGGSGPTDRDETVAGIPLFGQIARDLAAAGFMVVRYDRRGVGQSGGRAESVTISDYAEDVRSILRWLEKQKDEVDKDRMALAGHGDGASVALLAAGRERGKVSALALLGGVATSGADLVIEQQQHILSQMQIDDEQRAEKLELQRQIHEAVIKGTGWADLPPGVRQAADTPWFYSFLTFDPGKAMRDTRQPILILQGELDRQVAPHHADDLAVMARDRRGDGTVEVVKVPGVNHLLVEATTGEVAEYASLGPDAEVAGVVTSTLTTWLTKVLK